MIITIILVTIPSVQKQEREWDAVYHANWSLICYVCFLGMILKEDVSNVYVHSGMNTMENTAQSRTWIGRPRHVPSHFPGR